MKKITRKKTEKIVFTDGEYFYETRSIDRGFLTKSPLKAWNLYPKILGHIDTMELKFIESLKDNMFYDGNRIDISNFELKKMVYIETIKFGK